MIESQEKKIVYIFWVRIMKGSTLKRANLSREKVAMLEAFAKYNSGKYYQNAYPNSAKQDELDVLWQHLKAPSAPEKSSIAFFSSGVLVGIVSTLFVAIIMSFIVGYSPIDDFTFNMTNKIKSPKVESLKFTFIPADKHEAVVSNESEPVVDADLKEYTVQSGDSLESIAIKFYGSFDEAKIKGIQETNNLSNPNAIGIGQKLMIPMHY